VAEGYLHAYDPDPGPTTLFNYFLVNYCSAFIHLKNNETWDRESRLENILLLHAANDLPGTLSRAQGLFMAKIF
jgi:hypothetical protein